MKAKIFRSWRLALVLGGILFAFVKWQSHADAAAEVSTNADTVTETEYASLPPLPPDVTESPASASTVSTVTPEVKLSASVAEIVKLAQSGVSEEVLLAYVGNVKSRFGLGSDQIVYLNDVGISSAVMKAMIQRDAAIDADAAVAIATYNPPVVVDTAPPLPPEEFSDASMPPTDDPGTTMIADSPGDYATPEDTAYFYDSLAPYGSWVFVSGVGRCWQPTVYVRDHDWRPYGDQGRWVSSDCGWYWQSDYSWGWAAFHYGRWFRDDHRGWVWAPDRVWGPAWVSWRHSDEYCGWAPLPPAARFVPGVGFRFGRTAVGAEFEFGLRARHYTFIPVARMSDYAPARYSLLPGRSTELYHETKVINRVTFENHHVVSHGIDPRLVAKSSGTEIRTAEIHEVPRGNGKNTSTDRLSNRGDKMVIYRPQLPAPDFSHVGKTPRAGTAPTGSTHAFSKPTTSASGTIPATEHKPFVLVPPQRQNTFSTENSAANTVKTPANSSVVSGPKNASVASAPAPAPTPLPNMNLSYKLAYTRDAATPPADTSVRFHSGLPPVPDATGTSSSVPTSATIPNQVSRSPGAPTLPKPVIPQRSANHSSFNNSFGDTSRFNHTQASPILVEAQPSHSTYTAPPAAQPQIYQPRSASIQTPAAYSPATTVSTPTSSPTQSHQTSPYHGRSETAAPTAHASPVLTPPTYSHSQSQSAPAATPSYQAPPSHSRSETTTAPAYHSAPVAVPPSYSRSESAPAPSYHSAPAESRASSSQSSAPASSSRSSSPPSSPSSSSGNNNNGHGK